MVLSTQTCLAHVRQTLGTGANAPVSSELSELEIVNQAGAHFFAMHPWSFLEGRQATIGTVANQNYVTLPADCAEIQRVVSQNAAWGSIRFTTPGHLLDLRESSVGATSSEGHWGVVRWRPDDVDGRPKPIIEIEPPPSLTDATAFTIFYRAHWVDLTDDDGVVPIPDTAGMRGLFLQYVRAFARALEEEDNGALSLRLEALDNSSLCRSLKESEGRMQGHYGRLRGGAISVSRPRFSGYLTVPPAGPTSN